MPLSDLQSQGEREGCSRRRPPWDGSHWTRSSGQPSPFLGVKPPQLARKCVSPSLTTSRVSFRALPTGSGQKGGCVMRNDPKKRVALQLSAFLTTLQRSLAFDSKHIPGLRVSLASPAPAPGRLSWGWEWWWVADTPISISAHQGLLKSALLQGLNYCLFRIIYFY